MTTPLGRGFLGPVNRNRAVFTIQVWKHLSFYPTITMMKGEIKTRELTDTVSGQHTGVMDHARELVTIVYESAPGEYRRLLKVPRIHGAIAATNNFNYGKVYAFAEYVVFRREFKVRFPEASSEYCINAFSRLFLKNDISITNLVNFMESSTNDEMLLLKKKDA
jgi:hypothetical protein